MSIKNCCFCLIVMNKHRFDENDNNYRIESDELLIYITVLFVVQTFKLAGVADFFKAFCKNINHENGGGEKRIILIDFLSKKLKTVSKNNNFQSRGSFYHSNQRGAYAHHSYQQSEKNTSYFSHNSQLKSSEHNLDIDKIHNSEIIRNKQQN